MWILEGWVTIPSSFTSRLCDSISLSHSFLNRQGRLTHHANLIVLLRESTESTSTLSPEFDTFVGCSSCTLPRLSHRFIFHPRRCSPFRTRNNFSHAVFKCASYSASGFLEKKKKMLSSFTFLLLNLFSGARELTANYLPVINIILFRCRLHS